MICIWHHTLFELGDPPQVLPNAVAITQAQMEMLCESGLLGAASRFFVGINGDKDSNDIANLVLPPKAKRILHGLKCRNECRTILAMQQWARGVGDGWRVLYFHAKGATRRPDDPLGWRWRGCMERHVIRNWRQCIADLAAGYDAVGCHWMTPPATPAGQYIFAGTFFWVTSDFLRTLPLITERDRIKVSGLDSRDSRYEAEIVLGNGPRLPKVKDYHRPPGGWNPGKVGTCEI